MQIRQIQAKTLPGCRDIHPSTKKMTTPQMQPGHDCQNNGGDLYSVCKAGTAKYSSKSSFPVAWMWGVSCELEGDKAVITYTV